MPKRSMLVVGADDRWRARLEAVLQQAAPDVQLESEPDATAAPQRIAEGNHTLALLAHRLDGAAGLEVLGRAVAAADNARSPAVAMFADDHDAARDEAAERAGPLCTLTYDQLDGDWVRLLLTVARREARLSRRLRAALDKREEETGATESALFGLNQWLTDELLEVQRDIVDARAVQKSMLPDVFPNVPGISWHECFVPCADVGGDMYNVVALDDRRVIMYLLDVSGHGLTAALFSSALNRIVPWIARLSQAEGPAAFVRELSREFPMNEVTGQYFTIQYGVLDLQERTFRCTSAGHPGPLHLPSRGEPELFAIPGPPAGIPDFEEFEEITVQLHPGDRLLMFSDGLVEALNTRQQEFGTTRMIDTLGGAPMAEAVAGLQREVERWCEPAKPADDCTVVGFELAAES